VGFAAPQTLLVTGDVAKKLTLSAADRLEVVRLRK
jgi:hypothetical protein